MKTAKLLLPLLIMSSFIAAPIVGMSADQSTGTMQQTGKYLDDAAVTGKVKAALMTEPGLKSSDISVKTYEGKVQLSGFVDTQKTADSAVKKAESIEGVKSVVNSILIK